MSILVVCPGCRKSFQVSEKFAGKSGPCPGCKTVIKVPEKSQEVKVHAPTQFASGGRSVSGKLVTKPIARSQTKVDANVAAIIGAAAICVLVLAWATGSVLQTSLVLSAVGLLVVSPPLVVAAYAFLRNEELEPYRGTALYVRAAVCALGYVALWGAFAYVSPRVPVEELWTWVFLAPPLFVLGGLIAVGSLDLDFDSGFFHYAFYVLATLVLRWAAGMPWPWAPPPGPL